MLIAIAWWSVLLFTNNRDAFLAKSELNKIGMVAEGLVQSDRDFFQTEIYQKLEAEYKRQEWMILGESIVFVLSLIVGVYLINRGYNQEIAAAQ